MPPNTFAPCGPLGGEGANAGGEPAQALPDTAPEGLRGELRGLSASGMIRKASRFRPGERPDGVLAATKLALRSVARRCRMLSEHVSKLDGQLDWLVGRAAPELVAVEGVGVDTATSLLIAVGDNPTRLERRPPSPTSAGSPRFRPPQGRLCAIA